MRPLTFVLFLMLLPAFVAGQKADPFRYNNRGVAYLEQYEFRPASEEFQKALKAQPDFIPARVNLGIAHYYLADYPKATEQFREVLKQDPKQPHAHFMLGLIVGKEKNREEALQHFQQVLAVDNQDPATHYNLGLLHARNREYDPAVASFKKVLEVEPYHISALYNLAMTLMRSGKQDESRQAMARFQQLKSGDQAGGPMGAMGVQYGEEGKYALGIGQYEPLAAQSAKQLAIRFVEANADAGVQFVHAGPGETKGWTTWNRADYSPQKAENTIVAGFGSGSAFLDFDKDGKMDLFVVNANSSAQGAGNTLYRNVGNGKFQDVTRSSGLGLKHLGMGAAVGDFNNDTYPDLFITGYGGNHLFRNDRNGRFTDVTEEAGIRNSPTRWSMSAAFFDFDHDGDLDIYVTNFVDLTAVPQKETFRFPYDFKGQENQLLRNNGNGTFVDVATQAQVTGGKAKSTSVIFLDYNNSRDIDFLVVNQGTAPNLFSNKRDGTFEDVGEKAGLTRLDVAGTSSGDVNKDSYQDLIVPGFGSRILRNSAGRNFVDTEKGMRAPHAWASAVFDYDNDGWLDLLILHDKPRLYKNQGTQGFTEVSTECGLAGLPTGPARSAAVADYDADGDNDIFVMINGGKCLLLRNDGGNQNRSLRIDLAGLRDNKGGLGAKIEIRAGQAWQKLEINGNVGYLSQSSPELVFGLGNEELADSIRILWPTGVLQAELDRPAGQPVKIEEVDRKGTSCPLLYAWNGLKYDFVTDFLGGSAFGYLVAPGIYGSTDVDEYIKIANVAPQPKGGHYSIKMNNQLEEVMFIDQVKLLAVDHPSDVSVYPDEKLMPAPPYPSYKLFVTRDSKPPVGAVDEKGKDVLPALLEVDRKYPDSFKLLPFKGYADPHELILDLGDLSQAKRVLLLLTAWIDYADSSSNLAASQAGAKLVTPYLQVVDAQGRWVTVLESTGFPAGLPKTMTIDMTGKFLTKQDFRVKIVTSMRIYWDQILVDTYSGPVVPTVTTLGADRAGFEFYGYPREVKPDGKNPPQYDYHDRSTASPWKNHVGRYTRYGDVKPLLREKDDMYVIMRHGDEITAEFEADRLPALPDGWTRTFLVYAAGFGKDMDLNSANADTVGPLPSHSGQYPTDRTHQEYLKKYNTREVGETFDW